MTTLSQALPIAAADVLILAAYRPELVGLRPHLGDNLFGRIGPLNVVAKTIGVGIGVSGAGAANRIHQLNPRAVVLMGTCGVYPSPVSFRPLEVMIAQRAHLFDPAVASGKAEFPDPMQTSLTLNGPLTAALAAAGGERCHQGPVATTMAITTDDKVARAVHGATGLLGENLELFPVALACHAADVPCAAVLGITNLVGSTARVDWRQYQRDAVIGAAETIVTWLRQGAAGLPPRHPTG